MTPRPALDREGSRPAAAPVVRRLGVGVGLLITLGLAYLHLEYHRHAGPLWRDEVNSVNVASLSSYAEVFANSHLDSFPIAWVSVLHAWVAAGLGGGDAELRWLGLLIGLATVGVLWWSARCLGLAAPLVTLLLFAMSPTTIVYGDEVRGYGLAVLAIAWCMGAVWRFVERRTWGAFALAQLAAVVAVQAYFANCFLLLAIGVGAAGPCVRRRDWHTLLATLALGAVAALSVLVNLRGLIYASQVAPIEQGDWSLAWLFDMFGHALAPGVPLLSALWLGAAILATIGCVVALRAPTAETDRDRALFVCVTAASALVAYFFCLKFVARLPTQYWYYLSLMAVIALSCDVGVDLLARRVRRGPLARLAAVGVAAVAVAPGVAATVPVRMTNVDLAATRLTEAARPADLVVVIPWYCGITFARYYRGAAPWLTLPDFAEHTFHGHLLVAEKMKLGDAGVGPELERVEQTLRAGGRVWIVGAPRAPAPGQSAPHLPPAPTGPEGWRAAPYLDGWELQLGALLQARGVDTWRVDLPDPGAVNAWENLPLLVVEGWR